MNNFNHDISNEMNNEEIIKLKQQLEELVNENKRLNSEVKYFQNQYFSLVENGYKKCFDTSNKITSLINDDYKGLYDFANNCKNSYELLNDNLYYLNNSIKKFSFEVDNNEDFFSRREDRQIKNIIETSLRNIESTIKAYVQKEIEYSQRNANSYEKMSNSIGGIQDSLDSFIRDNNSIDRINEFKHNVVNLENSTIELRNKVVDPINKDYRDFICKLISDYVVNIIDIHIYNVENYKSKNLEEINVEELLRKYESIIRNFYKFVNKLVDSLKQYYNVCSFDVKEGEQINKSICIALGDKNISIDNDEVENDAIIDRVVFAGFKDVKPDKDNNYITITKASVKVK